MVYIILCSSAYCIFAFLRILVKDIWGSTICDLATLPCSHVHPSTPKHSEHEHVL